MSACSTRRSSGCSHGLRAMKTFQPRAGRARIDPEPRVADIESLDDAGRGIARIDGKVTFIDGALPGEIVRAQLFRSRKSFDQGVVLEVLTPSPDRVEPPCPHFGVCGGCSLQHLAPRAQLREKQALLDAMLRKAGGVTPQRWLEPLAGPVRHYRRSARLGVRDVPKKGGIITGFRERRSSYINPTRECLVLDARVARLLPLLPPLIEGISCRRRLPQIEIVCGDDAAVLVFRHLEPLNAADRERVMDFARAHDVQVWLQSGGPGTVTPLWPEAPAPLAYRLPDFDVTIRFVPTDFIQVNADINRRMVALAVDLLAPAPNERILDLFCGLGNFTLPLARRAGQVTGVEADPRLVDGARANAALNGIVNAEFSRVDLFDEAAVADFLRHAMFDCLLLDPPRSGAIEVLKCLPVPGPRRIVYVSCSPATLARDAEYLVNAAGYRMMTAGVLDMFPHTSHVESIAVFDDPRSASVQPPPDMLTPVS
jgi:23S rRNA (uracil1939-C5)-methyltransferase